MDPAVQPKRRRLVSAFGVLMFGLVLFVALASVVVFFFIAAMRNFELWGVI